MTGGKIQSQELTVCFSGRFFAARAATRSREEEEEEEVSSNSLNSLILDWARASTLGASLRFSKKNLHNFPPEIELRDPAASPPPTWGGNSEMEAGILDNGVRMEDGLSLIIKYDLEVSSWVLYI